MSERLLMRRVIAPTILVLSGALALTGCGGSNGNVESGTTGTTVPATPDSVGDPHLELYPIPTGRDDRSEVFKVINLDDGRRIECIESHILMPEGKILFDQDCSDPSAPTTSTTQPLG